MSCPSYSRAFSLLVFLGAAVARVFGAGAAISGAIVDQASRQPLEFVTVKLQADPAGTTVRTGATDAKGAFTFEDVPDGRYRLSYSLLGAETDQTAAVTVDAGHRQVRLGELPLASSVVKMDEVQVSARSDAFYNSIDRKVYNVGKDLISTTGSASTLLQNVPSVQVDVEGNVSLRGNDNVLILVNGKTSALMSTTNRADVLTQMPADSIERIEVITNPSAKYKPDGTSGIINITLKRKPETGSSAVLRANVGNNRRYNVGLTTNYRPGKYTLFGTFSLRQDERVGYTTDRRRHLDAATNTFVATEQITRETMRPLSRLIQTGADYAVDEANKIGVTADYNLRTFHRTSTVSSVSHNALGGLTGDGDRFRDDPEWQKTEAFAAKYHHDFAGKGHELDAELKHERHWEQENNQYSNSFRFPATAATFDATLMRPTETGTELKIDYVQPLARDAKLDAGYGHETNDYDTDFGSSFFDPVTARWLADSARSNTFRYRDNIDSWYATFGQPFGRFGFLTGLRLENTRVDTNQVTLRQTESDQYFRAYPTLHLSYTVSPTGQLQLNYSHRIHRPESEALNPFPEYQDPFNLRAGNPHLRPEDTHSIEAGYQYRKDDTTYLATVYYRDTYHGFTTVTRYIDNVTLLTTRENLANNRSGGVELGATTDLGPVLVNFGSNIYRNQIDATNLGFASSRLATTWNAKLNLTAHPDKSTMLQFNSNYTAARLTPQGERRPQFVANIGLRRELPNKRTAFVVTLTDIFNTMKESNVLDTPTLHEEITRARSSRVLYVGVVQNLGRVGKRPKDDAIKFEN